jgi:hypothetical protein
MAQTPKATLRQAQGNVFVPLRGGSLADFPGNKASYGYTPPEPGGAQSAQFPQVSAAAATLPMPNVLSLPNLGSKIILNLTKPAFIIIR